MPALRCERKVLPTDNASQLNDRSACCGLVSLPAAIWGTILFTGLMLAAASMARAEPFVPKNDAQVLERLPYTPGDPAVRELRARRNALARNPRNTALAAQTAERYIRMARAEGDPRYFGYAQAALEPWWHAADPPAQIMVLRAGIKQASHNFAGALNDLDQLLRENPDDLTATVTRAIILQVRGRYEEARRDCAMLVNAAQRAPSLQLTALTCVASVASLTGQAAPSYQLLKRTLDFAISSRPDDRQWAVTTLADIATRLGFTRAAERYYRAALAAGKSAWLQAAYADFLLDQNRPREVIELLADDTRVDTLLLLLALAEQKIGAPQLDKHVNMLRERFAAARLRDDQRHLREEARFTLHLLHEPQEALRLARANWRVQREPEDARILLQAALAAGEPKAAKPVVEFLQRSRLEDVRLEYLRRRFRAPADS